MEPSRTGPGETTPEALLDRLRADPGGSVLDRDAVLDELVARFPSERVLDAVRPRLRDLGGGDAEPMLRLIEANPADDLLRALAEAIRLQPDLPLERAWEALALLDGLGSLDDYPDLVERWDELNEALDEGSGSLDELAEQIERDPDEAWLALQGLGAVEPEVRAEIVAGLGAVPLGPGLSHFLRLLARAHDPPTRAAAVEVLERVPRSGAAPHVVAAWRELAENPPDPDVAARAHRWLGEGPGTELSVAPRGVLVTAAPRLVRSLVTALDGQGRGTIVLSSRARSGAGRVTAAFSCDIERGIPEVWGQLDRAEKVADATFEEFAAGTDLDTLADHPALALALLAGSLRLCGPETPPALRYWIEATIGPEFGPRPFPTPFPGWDPTTLPFAEMPARAAEVLAACPSWLDVSPRTYDLAEELRLRYPEAPPDPRRDAGAYRYLFEHRLAGRLELFRRMLFWMSAFWQASGAENLGRSALALAWQLSDPSHAVPSHPFTVALTTRSLAEAQANLGRGVSPRTPG